MEGNIIEATPTYSEVNAFESAETHNDRPGLKIIISRLSVLFWMPWPQLASSYGRITWCLLQNHTCDLVLTLQGPILSLRSGSSSTSTRQTGLLSGTKRVGFFVALPSALAWISRRISVLCEACYCSHRALCGSLSSLACSPAWC